LQMPGRPADQQTTNPNQTQFDPNTGQNQNTQQQQTNRNQNQPPTGGATGYPPENYASNVTPGSPGYYVTTGVFGSENNARRWLNTVRDKGFDVNFFRDSSNGMY